MIDPEQQRIYYARWAQSADWHEVILPALEVERQGILRQMERMDPRDVAEVAYWQAQYRFVTWLIEKPSRELERQAREEEREDDGRRREDRRTVRRLLTWTRGG